MKKGLLFVGGMIGAALVCSVAVMYSRDEEVRESVDAAVHSVRDVCGKVKGVVDEARSHSRQSWEQQCEQNRQWADQQWEALGI